MVGKKRASITQQQAATEAMRRRSFQETYTKPLGLDAAQTDQSFCEVKDFMKDFYKTYYSRDRVKEREGLLQQYPEIASNFQRLVPKKVTEEEFWQRYEYRCDPSRIARLSIATTGATVTQNSPPTSTTAPTNIVAPTSAIAPTQPLSLTASATSVESATSTSSGEAVSQDSQATSTCESSEISVSNESVVSRAQYDEMQKKVELLTAQLNQTQSLLAELSVSGSVTTGGDDPLPTSANLRQQQQSGVDIEYNCNQKDLFWHANGERQQQQQQLQQQCEIPQNWDPAYASSRKSEVGSEPPIRDIVVSTDNADRSQFTSGDSLFENSTNGSFRNATDNPMFEGGGDIEGAVMSSYMRSKYGSQELDPSTANKGRFSRGLGRLKKKKFYITALDLARLSNERTHLALANVLMKGIKSLMEDTCTGYGDALSSTRRNMVADVTRSIEKIRVLPPPTDGQNDNEKDAEMDQNAENAANALADMLLHSSPRDGIDSREVGQRKHLFGKNKVPDKRRHFFLHYCWKVLQDFCLFMLILLAVISIVIETVVLEDGKSCESCWMDGAAILFSVFSVVLITASIDYTREFMFMRLSKQARNTKMSAVVRDGKQLQVKDKHIVVGDIVCVNSHSFACIPADGVLLGTASSILKINESMLTGEVKVVRKKPGDILLAGTSVAEGSGKMIVTAVGVHTVAGQIKTAVYDSKNNKEIDINEDEETPLFHKLEVLSKKIGLVGTVAALILFYALCFQGLVIDHESFRQLIGYLINAITVLAIAVPEGLPLVVKLVVTLSSKRMTKEQNLVKHLSALETMGSVTTICTDKTGTLTANKMTARACCAAMVDYSVEDPTVRLSDYMKQYDGGVSVELVDLICRTIAIDTMDETTLYFDYRGRLTGNSGNPTEVALLTLAYELGGDYDSIRKATKGRAGTGMLRELLSEGRQFGFSSERKMMSWVVPIEGGGYRVYCKGAHEVLISRCHRYVKADGTAEDMQDDTKEYFSNIGTGYSERGMRCLGLAYRDLPEGFDLESTSDFYENLDGTMAFEVETKLTLIALIGIEDPLRPEVPWAIKQCYEAGMDIRLVTGDNPNTAVNIAYQAGILQDFHFTRREKVASNAKADVVMVGSEFRRLVYRVDADGTRRFDQTAFDRIWPHLRVLARCSPNDKLTLAHGISQSTLFADERICRNLEEDYGIVIYPDRQFVAVTGDGTNDAPALKRADVGFAMGIAGTQIAKDAADIMLLDDSFASIVSAVKWGRNVFVSIRKFLQFQFTASISAVVVSLLGVFLYERSPFAAIHLLWLSLLVDSLASIALASEPPSEDLLHRPPLSKCDDILTPRMYVNMFGQATYQILVILVLLFFGPQLLDIEEGHALSELGENSVHYTIIFNTYIWMQLFNEINCRNIDGGVGICTGILRNPLFCIILLTTALLQVIIVQFGSIAFHVSRGGLDGRCWLICFLLGFGSIPVQQLINLCFYIANSCRSRRRDLWSSDAIKILDKSDDSTMLSGDSEILFDEFASDVFSKELFHIDTEQSMLA